MNAPETSRRPARSSRRFSNVAGLAAAMAAFAGATALLDSGGLRDWAGKLEVGPKRTLAVPLTDALSRVLHPLGLEALRTRELAALGRVGWSDDPAAANARVAEVKPPEAKPVPPEVKPGPVMPPPPLDVSAPPATVALKPLPGLASGTTRVVGLAGDSMMAVGLAAVLTRGEATYPQLKFLKLYKSGTGLARPDTFDWMKEYPAMLGDAKPDVIVVALGANDAQGFAMEGKKVLAFGSPEWVAEYQRRVLAYLQMLQADGAEVVWVGLPAMRSEVFDTHVQVINQVTYHLLKGRPRTTWWPATALLGGRFEDLGEVDGKVTKVREGDGIHMTDDGAKLLTDILLPWLQGPAVPPIAPASPAPAGGR